MRRPKPVTLKVLTVVAILVALYFCAPAFYNRIGLGPRTPLGTLARVEIIDQPFGAMARYGTPWMLRFSSNHSAVITDRNRHLFPTDQIQQGYLVPGAVLENLSSEAVSSMRQELSSVELMDSRGGIHSIVSAMFGPTDPNKRVDTRQPELYFVLPEGRQPRYVLVRTPEGTQTSAPIPLLMIRPIDQLRRFYSWVRRGR